MQVKSVRSQIYEIVKGDDIREDLSHIGQLNSKLTFMRDTIDHIWFEIWNIFNDT